jgi:hypothetical protein
MEHLVHFRGAEEQVGAAVVRDEEAEAVGVTLDGPADEVELGGDAELALAIHQELAVALHRVDAAEERVAGTLVDGHLAPARPAAARRPPSASRIDARERSDRAFRGAWRAPGGAVGASTSAARRRARRARRGRGRGLASGAQRAARGSAVHAATSGVAGFFDKKCRNVKLSCGRPGGGIADAQVQVPAVAIVGAWSFLGTMKIPQVVAMLKTPALAGVVVWR